MSEKVIQWRAQALFNKFWGEDSSTFKGWVKDRIAEDPELEWLLVQSVTGGAAAAGELRQRLQQLAQQDVRTIAENQVAQGTFTIDRILDTLENQ